MNEIELLLTNLLDCNRAQLHQNTPRLSQLTPEQRRTLGSALFRRMRGEPIQYILGQTEFMGLTFKVSPGVFIPRPETEILVEKAIDILRNQKPVYRNQRILDIGTGSGNIAISLAKYLPEITIIATDIPDEALKLAKENAQFHGVSKRIEFIKTDIFATCNLRPATCDYDIIISNPPYIRTRDIEQLAPEVQHEPRLALDGGADGLNFYREIVLKVPDFLRQGGFLLIEIGFGQSEAIRDIVTAAGKFEIVEIARDYSGIERVLVAKVTRSQPALAVVAGRPGSTKIRKF